MARLYEELNQATATSRSTIIEWFISATHGMHSMKRLSQLIRTPQLPYKIERLEPIHLGNVRRFRAYVTTQAKDRETLQGIMLDVIQIARGKTSGVVFVFVYHDVQEVGMGMPVARAQFVSSGTPKELSPLGLAGNTLEVDGGQVTFDFHGHA